jgi:hypothetical protein
MIAAAEERIVATTKQIDYFITEYSIELLAKKMNDGDFVVPDYQRDFTWEQQRKWRFIESILMNLPVPFLFFWEDPVTGKLEIVDGSQRLRTLEEFILGDLRLGELEKLPEVSYFAFSDLPESRQRKVKNRSIRGIVLNEHADSQARQDLFDRINTGSKVANKAEIRRGALQGRFIDLVIELANNQKFRQIAPCTEKQIKEREPEELVTRFFAYGDGLDDYADEVSPFLFAYAKKMNLKFTEAPEMIQEYRTRFEDMVNFVAKSFKFGFRKSANGRVSPRARFESIAIGSYQALRQNPHLIVDSEKVQLWLEDKDFTTVTGSDGANAIKKLQERISFTRNKLLGG